MSSLHTPYALLGLRPHRHNPVILVLERYDLVVHQDLATECTDFLGAFLPHLSGAQTRILELVDERLDAAAAFGQGHRGDDRFGEGKPLDALRRPLSPNLGTRNPPHLLRVGLEEDLV